MRGPPQERTPQSQNPRIAPSEPPAQAPLAAPSFSVAFSLLEADSIRITHPEVHSDATIRARITDDPYTSISKNRNYSRNA
jgi:hypothetical protein